MLRHSPLCSLPHVRYRSSPCDPCRGWREIRYILNLATEPRSARSIPNIQGHARIITPWDSGYSAFHAPPLGDSGPPLRAFAATRRPSLDQNLPRHPPELRQTQSIEQRADAMNHPSYRVLRIGTASRLH
jgi:hypothetical protein